MMRRRDFLGAMGTGGFLGAATDRGWLAAAPPAAEPDRLKAIGIQLYTVRGEFAKDVEGTLSRIMEIGFQEVEFAGYPQGTAASLRGILDRMHLSAPSSHVALQSLRGEWERTLEEAAILGQKYIVVAFLPPAERRTLGDWKRTAALFNRAGEFSKRGGIQFCYHNHDFEFAPVENQIPYDLLLAETDPRLVRMELDLYWMTKAGSDPLDYFRKHPGRFPLVHVKDMDATPRKSFADVGTGVIDFKRIFKQSNLAGIRHYFYEQDVTPGAPLESARASYDYLRKLSY